MTTLQIGQTFGADGNADQLVLTPDSATGVLLADFFGTPSVVSIDLATMTPLINYGPDSL